MLTTMIKCLHRGWRSEYDFNCTNLTYCVLILFIFIFQINCHLSVKRIVKMAFLLFTIISQCTISDQIQSLETSPVGFKIITRHLVVSNGYPTVAVSFSPPKKFLFLSRVVTVSTNFCSLPASSHRWFLPRGIQKSNWVIKHLQLLTNAVLIFYTTPSLSPMSTIRGKTKIQTKLFQGSFQHSL